MKKTIIFTLLLASCSSTPKGNIDPVTDFLNAMGIMDTMNKKIELSFESLNKANPENPEYIACIKQEIPASKIADGFRPMLNAMFTSEELSEFNGFLKSELGNKFIVFSKNSESFENNSSYFSESEKVKLENYFSKFSRLFSDEANVAISRAGHEVPAKLFFQANEKCSHLLNLKLR